MKQRRGERHTFAEMIAEVESQPPLEPDLPKGPGYTVDGRIYGPDGRLYTGDDDIDSATELLGEGALVLIDNCGCRGGCAIEWVTDPADPRSRRAPRIRVRKNKHVDARMSEWRAADGHALVLFEGPKFRWPDD